MSVIYTAEATARGGREGEVTSNDGVVDLLLAIPKEMGGPGGDKSNPEQLFAAGYAACFHSAAKLVASQQKLDVTDSYVTAKVGIGPDETSFGLTVELIGSFPKLEPAAAQGLLEAAHQVCPYSKATRGNIEVTLTLA
jgi:Ohr subfamily peroxiredoxin